MKNRITKRIVLTLALFASIAALPSTLGSQVVLADAGGAPGHNFTVTFTKWITSPPSMAGIVGGDVGAGTFEGTIRSISTVGDTTSIEALYDIDGGIHSLDAHVFVTQNDQTNTAIIKGTVTGGWLQGLPVQGEYNVISACPGNPSGPCFQGVLQIHVG